MKVYKNIRNITTSMDTSNNCVTRMATIDVFEYKWNWLWHKEVYIDTIEVIKLSTYDAYWHESKSPHIAIVDSHKIQKLYEDWVDIKRNADYIDLIRLEINHHKANCHK